MVRALLTLLVIAIAVAAPFAVDILAARRHQVVVRGPLNVYELPTPEWFRPSNPAVARATEHDRLRVMRIHDEKEYIAIQVRLEDGRDGYIFFGDSFQLVPAL